MTTEKTAGKSKVREIARTLTVLSGQLKKATQPWLHGSEVMEIRRALLDQAEAQIQPLGGGKRLFPFNRGKLVLLAKKPVERAVLEASLAGEWNPEREIVAHLAACGCPAPELALTIEIVDKSRREFAGRRFHLSFERGESRPRPITRPQLVLSVVAGSARPATHTFKEGERLNLGRLEEVLDANGRLTRTNDVVFADDGSEVNLSVSREHAQIDYHAQSREFWLRDNRSAHGTQIFRGGRPIKVSSLDRQGLRLEDGDEVVLGRARLAVRVREG